MSQKEIISRYFDSFDDETGEIGENVSIDKSMDLDVDIDDIQELLVEQRNEITTQENSDLQNYEIEDLKMAHSSEDDQTLEEATRSHIKDMRTK